MPSTPVALESHSGIAQILLGMSSKDNYKKTQRGPNIGEPAAEVNEPMLRNMLKDANDGNDIVVLKSTSAGGSWKTRGAGPNST